MVQTSNTFIHFKHPSSGFYLHFNCAFGADPTFKLTINAQLWKHKMQCESKRMVFVFIRESIKRVLIWLPCFDFGIVVCSWWFISCTKCVACTWKKYNTCTHPITHIMLETETHWPCRTQSASHVAPLSTAYTHHHDWNLHCRALWSFEAQEHCH